MKKVLSVITFLLLAALLFGSSSALASWGDVNNDKENDNKDVVALFRFLSGDDEIIDEKASDINKDGKLNNKDVTLLFRHLTGKEYAKEFTVSRAVADNMVIQRNEKIRIWGWAPESEEGKYVRASFSGLKGEAVVENGAWTITLNGTLPENTSPQKITVSGGVDDEGETVKKEIKNVLVGDVYWIAGQSNIAYSVGQANSTAQVSSEAKDVETGTGLQIRLFLITSSDFSGKTLGTNEVSEDVPGTHSWREPRKATVSGFSALGYYTALRLYNALDRKVPIGMIEFDGNGLAIHSFLPNEVRDALKVSTYNAKTGTYSAADVNGAKSSFIYNLGMYPFQKLPIAGFIWYQGESDYSTANNNCTKYAERFTAFINYIREKHDLDNHDYPVYMVELPPIFSNNGQNSFIDFSAVRTNMGSIPSMLNNVHLCSTSDLWKDTTFQNNLHPYNKWEISERLTNIILANSNGVGNADEVEGPVAVSCEFSEDGKTATVKFKNVGDGLAAYGGVVKGIKAGITYGYEPTVQITAPDTLTISYTKKLKKIVYNYKCDDTFPKTLTLCNSAGVPCVAWSFAN